MTKLTFYGGVNEIGGNKILLEDVAGTFFLDFGISYRQQKHFYEEYLQPRSGAGLLDPLVMGLLPPLEGSYREDLECDGLWERFRAHPLYRKFEKIDGVLLSHAHFDHSGNISFLRTDIPVYATATTAFLARAIQDTGKSGFAAQVCIFTAAKQDCPAGCKQLACLSGDIREQRQFRIAGVDPASLSEATHGFWEKGFWGKPPRQKELIATPLQSIGSSPLPLRCYPVDHSIPGACAWAVETGSGWVVYSGDIRKHGREGELTEQFVEKASALKPKAVIIEGTRVDETTNVSEDEVCQNALKAIKNARGLVVADFAPRDIQRLLTFYRIAQETGRRLAILPRDAYLLKVIRLFRPDIPDYIQDANIVIYQDTAASAAIWMRKIYEECDNKVVLAQDVKAAQAEFILCFSFFDINELPGIQPAPGSLYVYSSSEPHDEEQELDFARLHHWLEHFKFQSYGLSQRSGDKWIIPPGEKGLHASGHACGPDLFSIVERVHPEVLIPVHTECPELFVKRFQGSDIAVVLPEVGRAVEI